MKCAIQIKLPCLALLHAGLTRSRGFLNRTKPAVRADHVRVREQGHTGNCQVLFKIGSHAQQQWLSGWFLWRKGVCLFLRKIKKGLVDGKGKKESV